jgi:hypothetical protein
VLPAALEVREKELAQAVRDQLAFLEREMRMVAAQLVEQALRQREAG